MKILLGAGKKAAVPLATAGGIRPVILHNISVDLKTTTSISLAISLHFAVSQNDFMAFMLQT